MDRSGEQGSDRTGASPEAIISHYDMGDDFFQLVLGPDLIYSCALFEDGENDLASAQNRKLDHHIDAAKAFHADRVLDIGCGWGALLRRLSDVAGVKSCTGLTLSPSQANWIRQNPRPGLEVFERDWRDHTTALPYDAIISIGAFEHFIQKGLSPEQRLASYRSFFDFCKRSLRSGGRLSLQTIAHVQPMSHDPMIEETFPESDLPLVWEPLAASQGVFRLEALVDHGLHYEKTLRLWEAALERNREAATNLVGAGAVEKFRRYLRLSRLGFRHGMVGLLRMSFVRID